MLLGLMTQLHDRISVYDFGINNITDADGLAVASPSSFIGKTLEQMISGVYTVQDATLYKYLYMISNLEDISLEPSALAGMPVMKEYYNEVVFFTSKDNNLTKAHVKYLESRLISEAFLK